MGLSHSSQLKFVSIKALRPGVVPLSHDVPPGVFQVIQNAISTPACGSELKLAMASAWLQSHQRLGSCVGML